MSFKNSGGIRNQFRQTKAEDMFVCFLHQTFTTRKANENHLAEQYDIEIWIYKRKKKHWTQKIMVIQEFCFIYETICASLKVDLVLCYTYNKFLWDF